MQNMKISMKFFKKFQNYFPENHFIKFMKFKPKRFIKNTEYNPKSFYHFLSFLLSRIIFSDRLIFLY